MYRLTSLSIRWLLLLIALVVALPAAGIILYSGIQFRNEMLNDARKETRKLVDRIVTEQQALVVGAEQLMTALAQLPEVKHHDAAGVEPILRELRKLNPMYSNIFIADRNGRVWATAVPVKPPFIVSDRRYFKNALESGHLSSGEYVLSRATSKPAFNLAYPLKDNHGAVIGVISVGFVIDQYRKLLEQMQLPAGSSFILIDHQGMILYRAISPESYIGKPYMPNEFKKMKDGPESGTSLRLGYTGEKRYISYRKLRLGGERSPYMYVTAGIPMDVAAREANLSLALNLALLTLFLVLAFLAALLIGKISIMNRIRLLIDASQRLATGNLQTRVSDLVAGGELGQLGQTFDAMAAELAKRESERLQAEEERNRLVSIMETTTDLVGMASPEGNIFYYNRAGRELTGIVEQPIPNVSIKQVHPKWAADLIMKEGFPAAIRHGVWVGESAILDSNGQEVPLSQVILSHRDAQGNLSHFSSIMRDIREQKTAEKVLERNRNLLNETQKLAHIGSWELDLVSNTLIWSDELYSIFELLPSDFGPTYETFLQGVHPDDRELVNKTYRKSVQQAIPYEIVHRLLMPDGRVKIVQVRGETEYKDGRPVRSYGSMQDITEVKLVEEEQHKLACLVERSRDFIGIASMDGHIIYLNNAAIDLIGLDSIQEACTKTIFDFFPEETRMLVGDSIMPGLVAEGYWENEVSLCNFRTGELIDVEMTAFTIFDEAGRPVAFAYVSRDITERKTADVEKSLLTNQLIQAQKMESIGRLAGGVAHDFNNLLTPIMCYSELLKYDLPGNEAALAKVGNILKAADRAKVLVQQLLSFSRKRALEMEIIDLNQTIKAVYSILRHTIIESIDIRLSLTEERYCIRADRNQIEQVIMNLAVNAQDAIGEHGVITLETAPILLDDEYALQHSGVKPGLYLMLAITNDGCGMDQDTQQRIFEPFFTTKGIGKGTGLGLATVYGIVQQHGGNIWVFSEPRHGTTFKCYFPLVDGLATCEQPPVHEKVTLIGGKRTILLVEDNEMVRTLVADLLTRQGFEVIVAEEPKQALRISENRLFDLLITDVVMPGMTGLDLHTKLLERYPGLEVLFMSGYASNIITDQMVVDKGFHYIEKPFAINEFAKKVETLLKP